MDKAVWTIPAVAMKKDREHIVPLSRQALAILRAMKQINGVGPYVFGLGKPVSPQTCKRVAQRVGWHDRHVAHGFRVMASTILHGQTEHGFRPQDGGKALPYYRAIEAQLAHRNSLAALSGVDARVSRAYDRNELLPIYVELMQWWADRLDIMASGLRLVAAS
jgi:integrase